MARIVRPGSSVARRDLIWLVLAATCWGLGTALSKRALSEFPALSLFAIQLAASLVVLTVLMRIRGPRVRSDRPALLGRLGLLNPGVAYPLSLLGLMTITVSLSVLLWALEPMLIIFLAGWFLHERITRATVVLSIVAIGGVVIVAFDPGAGGSQLAGVALTVAGVVCCAAYTVIARRWIPSVTETTQVVLAQQAHALALALAGVVLAALVGGAVVPIDPSPAGLASAVVSGGLYYAGAYWFYLGALRHVPAAIAASSFYLIPVVGLAAGAMLLGERLDPRQWVGVVVVLAAVVAIARQPTTRIAQAKAVTSARA